MARILVLGKGSKNDIGFADVQIGGMPFKEHMNEKGVTVIDDVVESCHGCPDLMREYSRQLQGLADNGNRIVAVLQGGLYFALPSMQATQVTFPIISCPLDYVAFQAFIVPPGNAAIATVGIEKQIPHKKEYVHSQREKALLMAEKMLNLEGAGVELSVGARFAEEAKKIEGELQKLGIRTGSSQLRLIYDYALSGSSREGAINLFAGSYLPQITIDGDEARIRHCPDTLQVHGATNLAVYAAKILSLQDSAIREKLKKMAADKRATYGGGRALDAEFQCMTAAGRGE